MEFLQNLSVYLQIIIINFLFIIEVKKYYIIYFLKRLHKNMYSLCIVLLNLH
jgi:hypothetical protein